MLTKQIEDLRKKDQANRRQFKVISGQNIQLKSQVNQSEAMTEKFKSQFKEFMGVFKLSEHQRISLSSKCSQLMTDSEKTQNKHNSLLTRTQLLEMEQNFVKDQLAIIYESFSTITATKLIQDQHAFQVESLQTRLDHVLIEKQLLDQEIVSKSLQNDQLMKHLKEVKDLLTETMQRRDYVVHAFKNKNHELIEALKAKREENHRLKDRIGENEQNLKLAVAEVMGLRKRIDKLKFMNIKVFNQKICRNCQQEYNDTENYNWSCRTHPGEFGGVIWWCCGRKNKDDAGCRFGAHEPKDESANPFSGGKKQGGGGALFLHQLLNNEGTQNSGQNGGNREEQVKCQCCKKHGHSMANCGRDPNLKTITGSALSPAEIEKDELRILKIELEADQREKHGGIDRFNLFNKFLKVKLDEAMNLNRQVLIQRLKLKQAEKDRKIKEELERQQELLASQQQMQETAPLDGRTSVQQPLTLNQTSASIASNSLRRQSLSVDLHLKSLQPTPSPSQSRRTSVASLAQAFLFEKKSTFHPESDAASPKNNNYSPVIDEAPAEVALIDENLYLERCRAIVKQVSEFLMKFDDYNYFTTNKLIERQIAKFRSEARNPKRLLNENTGSGGANLDKDNMEKFDLEQMVLQAQKSRRSTAGFRRQNGLNRIQHHRSFPVKSHTSTLAVGGDGMIQKPDPLLAGQNPAALLNVINLNEKVGYFHQSPKSRTLKGRSKSSQKDLPGIKRLDTVAFIDLDIDVKQGSSHNAQLSSDSDDVEENDSVEVLKNEILQFEIDDVIEEQQKELFDEILDQKQYLALRQMTLEKMNMINIANMAPGLPLSSEYKGISKMPNDAYKRRQSVAGESPKRDSSPTKMLRLGSKQISLQPMTLMDDESRRNNFEGISSAGEPMDFTSQAMSNQNIGSLGNHLEHSQQKGHFFSPGQGKMTIGEVIPEEETIRFSHTV
ncbi:hypothetical protein FGO68_gene4183 [Halteria grandinella]|uniref:Uncharacterized protein n=1 Tax=Halteria grandinella TaxID=5974 RepID=A0A8J8T985_HALGN|nr:hypothetical protein FGO68_gene4183 [Halteria grandinella]